MKDPNNRVRQLKVKIKSLAAEAQIIRMEENRSLPGSRMQQELHQHRTLDVRKEQRNSFLAYAFLRGIPLSVCEKGAKSEPDWKRVAQIVDKFGTRDYYQLDHQRHAFNLWKAQREVRVA